MTPLPSEQAGGFGSPALGMSEFLTVEQGFVRFAPEKYVSLREAITLVSCAIAFCCDEGRPRLLVNAAGLVGFDSPTLGERYAIVQEWARVGAGRVVIAVVARPEHIRPDKFGVYAAYRLGLRSDVFVAESEAREWLLHQEPLRVMRAVKSWPSHPPL